MAHFSSNTSLRVAETDFDNLRSSLETFLKSNDKFLDYDFDSSGISMILDILAYNTYHTAFYLNMVGNESFLSTAQRRENVVARAKMLGYTPRSAQGATAYLNITISPDDSPTTITINKNERFTTTIDGAQYTFVTPNTSTISADSSGNFVANVEIVEGEPLTHRFTVDDQSPVDYVIPNANVDTRSIEVRIQESDVDTTKTTYNLADSLTEVLGNSEVYFLEEVDDGKYEVYFGDNTLGKKPVNDNIVIIDYRVCNADVTNGANNFTAPSTLGGYSDFTINSTIRASGGDEQESISSIKFNAPKNYEAQDRAVTNRDYISIIKNKFADIQSVNVWGGEENIPPKYGQVFISIKPKDANLLTETRKGTILDYLQDRSVLSIDPVIVDPAFLYIVTNSIVKYNPKKTTLSPAALLSQIETEIQEFETEKLGEFGEEFIHSDFVHDIAEVNDSFTGAQTSVTLQKRIVPITGSQTTYSVEFGNEILNIGYKDTITSSKFTYAGQSGCKLDIKNDTSGTVRIYYIRAGERVYLKNNIGSIDFNSGTLTLTALNITSYEGDTLKINAIPKNLDVETLRNQILLMADSKISVYNNDLEKVVSTTSVTTSGDSEDLNESGILNTVF